MSAQYPAVLPVDNAAAARQCIEVAQEVAKQNPPKPRQRSVEEIKNDLRALIGEARDSKQGDEGILPRWTRLLQEATEKQVEVSKALKTVKENIAELERSGQKGSPKYQELAGFKFYSKKYQWDSFHDGSLQLLEARLAELNRLVENRTRAVEESDKRVKREVPVLKDELRAALRRDALHR